MPKFKQSDYDAAAIQFADIARILETQTLLDEAALEHLVEVDWTGLAALLESARALPAMLATLRYVADHESACTCNDESWHGEGHASGCVLNVVSATLAQAQGGAQ